MKKIIFTIGAFALMFVGVAQNEKPVNTEPSPDSLQQKANYNTTRSNKTIAAPDLDNKKINKKKEKTNTEKGGGLQMNKSHFTLIHDTRKISRDLK